MVGCSHSRITLTGLIIVHQVADPVRQPTAGWQQGSAYRASDGTVRYDFLQ